MLKARTSHPLARSVSARWEPINPSAPVMRILLSSRFMAFRFSSENWTCLDSWRFGGVGLFGKFRAIAVRGTGSRVHEFFDGGFLGGPEHVQETGYVRRVSQNRVFDGTGHGAQSGLVKDAVRARANLPACFQVADVAFDEREIFPLVRLDRLLDFVQVAPVAGGEVVEADDRLVERQELFQEVGAYEAGDSGYEPGFRAGFEAGENVFVGRHGFLIGFPELGRL